MKKSLCLSVFLFPSLVLGMEQPDQKTRIIPALYQMSATQLTAISTVIQDNFRALAKEQLIQLPFSPDQGQILHHYFGAFPQNVPGAQWKIDHPSSSDVMPIYFCMLMKFYADIQNIHEQHVTSKVTTSSFAISAAPPSSPYTLDLNALTPYVLDAIQFGPFEVDHIELTQYYVYEISRNKNRFEKICHHFKDIQHILRDLPTVTTWNWLELRYHLNHLGEYFGGEFKVVGNHPVDHEHAPYASLFSGKLSDTKDFLTSIKTLSAQLKEHIALPFPEQNKSGGEVGIVPKGVKPAYDIEAHEPDYRTMLKVFLNQLPQIVFDLEKNIEECPQLERIFTFWHLYLDLNKKYYDASTGSTSYSPDTIKLTILFNTLFDKKYTENAVKMVAESQQGRTTIHSLSKSFHNPFSPLPSEVLAFTYYKDQLSQLLEATDKSYQEKDHEKENGKSLRKYIPGLSYFSNGKKH